uniref:Uncharacterized protein n=1 Tax=Oryza nivara TaxID=4536 RepID=A0A0E0IPZ0_ORYNI
MLLDDTNSRGKPPDSELWDKLRHTKLVRSPSDGYTNANRAVHRRVIKPVLEFVQMDTGGVARVTLEVLGLIHAGPFAAARR